MYIELHTHSAYSFLDGASLPEELVIQAEALGYPALALTDHNGLYGSMEFGQQAKGRGLQAITGAEVTLENGSHLTLLAETAAGYANLCRLISASHQGIGRGDPSSHPEDLAHRGSNEPAVATPRSSKTPQNWGAGGPVAPCDLRPSLKTGPERLNPMLPFALLERHAEGLIALSGCSKGEIAAALGPSISDAVSLACWYTDLFGPENFFLEVQQNLVYGDTPRIQAMSDLARRTDLGMVATNNVHYHRRERHRLQDTMVAVHHCTTLDNSHRQRRANSEFYLKSPEEMARLFQSFPEALENTLQIADRCRQFDITRDLGYAFPDFQQEGKESADEVLARVCWDTFRGRYAGEPETIRSQARRRILTELDLVRYHRLAGFFLVYRDLLELAKKIAARVRGSRPRGRFDLPPGRGRGSSVSSIICYLIGLSPVDPIKAKLALGRFLNKELASVPDIDLDFPRDIREELIREVHQHYGKEHVAMVATFPTYRLRSAVRDIGKALGLPPEDVDRLARLSEGGRTSSIEDEMRRLPGFEQAIESGPWRRLIETARELQGFPRHLSQHPGGLIISTRPLVEIVPIEHSRMEGRSICQWHKDSCDDARFIKIDFLALGMLSAVEECLDLIELNGKPPVDLTRIDFNDKVVYDRICAGDTVGVFQIESRAQIQMLPRTQPRNLEDLAVEVAIVRPGPIVGGSVNPYVRNRERQRHNPTAQVYFEHPLLIPVLKNTLGVILYQDQVLEVCQALAGFSVGRAEALRRAMSRRRSHEAMDSFRDEFVAGAARKGVDPFTAERVFEKVLAFSAYGFPKSHAAAFAILTYQSTWLCHYYPAEFTAALLNNRPMGFYPLDVLLKDAERHGVHFRRPDINESSDGCSLTSPHPSIPAQVLLGLGLIDGIGSQTAKQIVMEREHAGPFLSLPDFVRRVPLPCGAVENLIEAGVFDRFHPERRMLLWQLGLFIRAQGWMDPRKAGSGSRIARNQPSLPLSVPGDDVSLQPLKPWERLLSDYRLMALSPDGHPMSMIRPALPKGALTTRQIQQIPADRMVHVTGLVVTRQRPNTAAGFLFMLVEDEFGLVNVVVSPKLYEARRAIIRGEPLVWIRGTVQCREGSLNLIAADIGSLLDTLRDIEADPSNPIGAFLKDLKRAAPEAHSWR